MSLLADINYLLQSLRLTYVRDVLPNHAPQGASTGVGPHNLIEFDPMSPVMNAPYVVYAGLADEARWPELSSGRNSPPLAPNYGRNELNGSHGALGRRRHGGATGLAYTQTIGKGPPVDEKLVGRRRVQPQQRFGTPDAVSSARGGPGADARPDNPTRRSSLETSIHRKRLSDSLLKTDAIPPPVVVHSPSSPRRTPFDSISSTVDPSRVNTPGEFSGASDEQDIISDPAQLTSAVLEAASQRAEGGNIAQPIDLQQNNLSLANQEDHFASESAPMSPVSGSLELARSSASTAPPPEPATPESLIHPTSPQSQSPASPAMVEPSISLGPRYASGASSGVSLFGVSRTLNSGEDVALHGQTSDEQLTTDQDTTVDQDTDKPGEPEPIQPRFRPRERRRVNISGRAFVPIAEPVHEEDHPDAGGGGLEGTRPAPNPASPNASAGTGPAGDAQIEGSPRTRPDSTSETRLHPPPGPSGTGSPVRSSETLDAGSSAPSSAPRRRPRESLSRHGSSITFERRPELVPADVKAAVPKTSALTALLTAKSESPSASNPFSPLYAALITRASDALKLTLYFPHSESPSKALKIGVKKDLTVEEVIGAGLWAYWEEGREPKIELEADGIDDESTRWNLRIVEDDGEVDEDFPALDRSKGISAFSFGEFAIVKATERQVTDNQAKQGTIVRRPSRVLAGPRRSVGPSQPVAGPVALPAPIQSDVAPEQVSSSLAPAGHGSYRPPIDGVSSSSAVPVSLKVQLPPAMGSNTALTIEVPNDMYMNDVLDLICKKQGVDNPKDWALVVRHKGGRIVVPLDRHVDSLGSQHDLTLVRRNQIASQLQRGASGSGHGGALLNIDPSASIFKQLPAGDRPGAQQPKYQSAMDLTTNYKKWNVQRKLPVPLGRHPRTIAIDGDYLHFMPSDTKGVVEGGRTTSLHISLVNDCRLSRRAPNLFKITVSRAHRAEKRYDFEVEDPRQAHEIVDAVRRLMTSFREEEAQRQRLGGGVVVY